jgi:hypothetical protein
VLERTNFTATYLSAAGIALIGGSVFALVSLHQYNR